MGSLKTDLQLRGLDLIETHISWVFVSETDVWKVKKPVSLGFLDFSTPERRREACDAEVRLNRRLAPGVYLGVEPVTRDADGLHALGGSGTITDWAVHMRRLPDRRRADVLLADGALGLDEVEHIATQLAQFHAQARSDDETARFGTIDAVGENVVENFSQTRESVAAYLEPGQAAEIETWQTGFLHDNPDLFTRRIVDGRVRDGHGDLRLEHVYLETDHLSILDCIEFNERFRYADVAADTAFLSMDLAWHGRVDLAEAFLAAYAREANDYDLYPLIDFYESYRAYVRGKVASLLANDSSAPWPTRERAAAEARRYYLLALATERRSLVSQHVVAVGGLMGSGKSTVARQVGFEMPAPVVETDRTRKWLLGVNATHPLASAPWSDAYAPDTTERVYEEVLRRAAAVLRSGRPVIVDASFRSRAHRDRVRDLARQHGVPFAFVECTAPESIRAARLKAREGRTTVSDGRLEIDEDFRASWEPPRELPGGEHIVLNTAAPVETNIATLRASLAMWPPAGGATAP